MEAERLSAEISGFGRALFGIAVAGLAMLSLVYGNFAPILEKFPALLPCPEAWIYGSGSVLLAAGAGLFLARTAWVSAMVIGAYALVWVVTRACHVLVKPLSVGSWYGLGEALGPFVGAWILCILLCRKFAEPTVDVTAGDGALRVARVLFGAACVSYGAAHFAYATYTAKMVPAWLPARTGITYLTGACHAAAGFGLLAGVLPRLAARLEGIMLMLFGAMVWSPSFFAKPAPEWAPSTQVQWSETLLTLMLAASALIVASSLRGTPWRFGQNAPDKSAAPVR